MAKAKLKPLYIDITLKMQPDTWRQLKGIADTRGEKVSWVLTEAVKYALAGMEAELVDGVIYGKEPSAEALAQTDTEREQAMAQPAPPTPSPRATEPD